MSADVVAIGHKQGYLRGRSQEEMDGLFRAGLERVGMTDVASYDTEVESLAALVARLGLQGVRLPVLLPGAARPW